VAAAAPGAKATAQAAAPVKTVATRIVFADAAFLMVDFMSWPFLVRCT
jgi:hypothetical protein